jgi:prepilin-type N-terminal cleavage/methylation domain-containing protein
MSLQTLKNQKGFTIVELLIVIVVIGILAAITIVAFNGIQDRGKTSSGQALASSVAKKIEAIQSVQGAYTSAGTGALTGAQINTAAGSSTQPVGEARLDTPSAVIGATSATASGLTTSNADNGKVVSVWTCTNGANVYYLDFSSTSTVRSVKAGQGC